MVYTRTSGYYERNSIETATNSFKNNNLCYRKGINKNEILTFHSQDY